MPPVSSSKIEFIRAHRTQADELASWIKRYYTFDHIAFYEAEVKLVLSQFLGCDSYGQAFFVNVNSKILGYFILTYAFDVEFGGRLAIVTDLFLDEAARGEGLGARTLDFIHSHCEELGIASIELQVETDNLEAQSFYEKSGFKKLSRFILSKRVRKKTP